MSRIRSRCSFLPSSGAAPGCCTHNLRPPPAVDIAGARKLRSRYSLQRHLPDFPIAMLAPSAAGTLDELLQRRPYNAASDFVDANVVRGFGDKLAFTDGQRSLNYGELQEQTWRFACALRALGIRQENRIILLLHDSVDFPVAFWGAIRAGIVPVPVNTLLTDEQYGYLLADSRAAAVVVVAAPLPA